MFEIKNQIVTIEKKDIISIKKLIDIFKGSAIFTREDKFYYFFRIAFGLADFDGKKHYKNLSQGRSAIREYTKKELIDEADAEFLDDPCFDFKVTLPPKEVIDETIEKHFKIKSIRQSFIHPTFTCYKIYFGEVKK